VFFRSGRANGVSRLVFISGLYALPTAALAANPTSPVPAASEIEAAELTESAAPEIVVTGTLVRGIAPVGALVSTIDRSDIARVGATTTNQLLSTIPQMSNAFNVLPTTPTAAQGRTTFRPNLRNLPSGGNGATLLLIDGRNMVGSAIQQNSPDIGALPPGAIERVDRKSTRLNSSHNPASRMPSSA
jgi:iron complex outermembrane receptor protein